MAIGGKVFDNLLLKQIHLPAQKMTAGESPSRHCYVVGVDVGSRWTRVSYGWSANVSYDEIKTINTWPASDAGHKTAEAVPTEIAYVQDQNGTVSHRWGYLISPGMLRYSCIKLLLDQATDDPDLRATLYKVRQQLPPGRSAWQVTVDFLRQVYAHILATLGQYHPDQPLDCTRIKFWLSTPASWSEQTQSRMWGAARQAGFGSRAGDGVMILLEPEAAMFAAVADADADFHGDEVELNENILVCDCGGSTVDVAIYRLVNDDPWELAEGSIRSRTRRGAANIDRRLHQLLSKRFGRAYESLLQDRLPRSRMMWSFELNKRRYGSRFHTQPLSAALKVPASRFYDPVKGQIILTSWVSTLARHI
ncbi:hypothetical protein AbraIFM66950_006879, partial [Aspergillus brasiliensis]